jgi:hypothetical protein
MRIRPERVTPIEVWDLPVQDQPLQVHRFSKAFPDLLARSVAELRTRPPGSWPEAIRERVQCASHVYLAGGAAADVTFRHALLEQGLDVTVADDPVFAAARAGSVLMGGDASLCMDVGQTSLKFARRGEAWSVPRDFAQAPLRDETPVSARKAARQSTIRFLASSLASSATGAEASGHEDIVVALPCEFTADGAPRGCSYCWEDPDPRLLSELAATLHPKSLRALNDAELAAVAADSDPRLPRSGAVLVLTIGHGVGGALLDRCG